MTVTETFKQFGSPTDHSIDLRHWQDELEQDVFCLGAKPSLGIQVPCALTAKGGWVENPELHRRKSRIRGPYHSRIIAGTVGTVGTSYDMGHVSLYLRQRQPRSMGLVSLSWA